MAALNTITLDDLVANKDILFDKGLESVSSDVRGSGIYDVGVWEPMTGDTKEYSEIDLQEYANTKAEGDDALTARIQQGYSKTVSPIRFGNDINISWELRRRGKYREISQRLTSLGRMTKHRMELDATHRIGFGDATSYTNLDGNSVDISTGDGLALFSTAHLLRGTSSTYRNILANNPRLAKGSLESMEQMKVENTLNQFGNKMGMTFDILFTSDDPNTVNTARELLQSTAEISAPNAGVMNVYRGKYRHVILPLLATDANGNVDTDKRYYWGLASSINSDGHMDIEEEPNSVAPTPGSNAEEFSTDDWYFKGRASYSLVWTGGRSVSLSKGDNSA